MARRAEQVRVLRREVIVRDFEGGGYKVLKFFKVFRVFKDFKDWGGFRVC